MTEPSELANIILTVETGPCRGRRVVVHTRQAILGRDSACNLCLDEDATVSREHASLSWEGGTWVLRDLGSKNGTALLADPGLVPITGPQPLRPGQSFALGSATIATQSEESTQSPATEQLRIVCDGAALVFEHLTAAAVASHYRLAFHEAEVRAAHRALLAALGAGQARGDQSSDTVFLERTARLTRLLLPPELAARLSVLDSGPLALLLDPALLDLPWESLSPDGVPLGNTRAMARQALLANTPRAAASRGRRILLVANPTGDLPHAHAAAEALLHALTLEHGLQDVSFVAGPRATLLRVAAELEQHDAVLYLGHAGHDPDEPARSGWRLADGLMSAERFAALQSVPALIIASACSSARETSQPEGFRLAEESAGAAVSLMLAGAEQFVGTLWPVPAVSGSAFGTVLLRGMLEGRSAGDAMLHARHTLREAAAPWEVCSGFVHYGRPEWRLHS